MATIALKIITHAIQVVTVISCIWYLSKKRSFQPYRLFAAGWMIVLCYDLVMVIIGLINPVKNHWVYNIAFPLIQLFNMWFFIHQLQQKKLAFLIFLFIGFATCNLILWQGELTLNTYSLALGGIITLFLASLKIFRLYKLDTSQTLFADPDFWMCSGFIFYWALATPFFAMYNFLWQTYADFFIIYFYTVNFGFTIVLNICIIKAFQCSLNTARR